MERLDFYVAGPKHAKDRPQAQDEARIDNYAAAAALVHMLMTTDSPTAVRFRQTLREGARIHNAAAALDAADLDDTDLDRAFAAYLDKDLPWSPHDEDPLPALGEVRQHDLGEARTLIQWARLSAITTARGAGYLDGAVAAAPQDPEVQFWQGRSRILRGQRQDAERLFKSALAHDPDNAAYQLALVVLYLDGRDHKPWTSTAGDVAVTAALDHLTKIARTATELGTVAVFHLFENRPEVARPLAERACHVGPDCWQCFHAYALATFRTGDVTRAAALERSALDRLPDAAPARAEPAIRHALRYYQAAAANPGARPVEDFRVFFPW